MKTTTISLQPIAIALMLILTLLNVCDVISVSWQTLLIIGLIGAFTIEIRGMKSDEIM